MSEARAVTNFAGNAVATVVIGSWTKSIDSARVQEVLAGRDPFDETTMVDDAHGNEIPPPGTDHEEIAPEPDREPALAGAR
jgi:aerobic C4-dicarboxylate transport protein